jgi:Flp pilus assembly protein TadD
MQKRKLWCVVVAAALIGLSAGGCQNPRKKQSKEATARWNHARAGVMLSLAQDQYKNGSFDKCRQTLADAMKMDPKNVQLRMLSAKLALEQAQLELAEQELETVRKIAPNNPEGYYLSGVVYQRWQKSDRAYEFYTAASDKAPGELSYILARAEMMVDLDRQEEALSLLKDKVVYFENSAAIRDAVGQLLSQKKQYHDAVDMFRQASILEDQELTFKERLGLALYYDKNYTEAADVLGKLVAKEGYGERADLLLALGESQLQLNKNHDARQTFESATQKDPSDARAWLGLGRAAMESKDYRRAELALKKAQSLDASSPDAHLMFGYLRLRQGKSKDALAAFYKASQLDPADSVAVSMMGYTYEKGGRKDLAMKYYGKALKINPNDPMALKLMAALDLND